MPEEQECFPATVLFVAHPPHFLVMCIINQTITLFFVVKTELLYNRSGSIWVGLSRVSRLKKSEQNWRGGVTVESIVFTCNLI